MVVEKLKMILKNIPDVEENTVALNATFRIFLFYQFTFTRKDAPLDKGIFICEPLASKPRGN